MKHNYVIGLYGEDGSSDAGILGLNSRCIEGAIRMVRWQLEGGFNTPFFICEYDHQKGCFTSGEKQVRLQFKTPYEGADAHAIESGRDFYPTKGIFTTEAWNSFLASHQNLKGQET